MTRQSRTTTWENLELRTRGETERQDVQHQWRGDNQDQHSAHETRHLTSECARGLLVSSCCRHLHSLHTTSRGSRLKCACACLSHLIHAWSERHSSTLSTPFHPTSSSPYSPSISLSSCCPPTSTRIVVTLCTPPTRRWILRTNPTPAQVMSPKTTTSWRRMSSPSQSPWPRNSSPSITMTPRSRRCFITHTENMSISLPARRLVCWSVVVVRFRKTGGTRCWKNRETCCGKRSGAKHWARTD